MAYLELQKAYNELLELWQRDMKRAHLLAVLAKESGVDLDWILKADDETVTGELVKHVKPPLVIIDDPLKPWTPCEGCC